MTETIFSKIIRKEIPAEIVYEDEKTLAFLDINPVNRGHTLLITKTPYKNLYEIADNDLGDLMKVVKKVAISIKAGLGADGINIEMNNETAAGQIVMHAHIHIIPRFEGDGLKHWPGKIYKEGEAKEIGEKIRNSF